jgi:hypothetical protein
MTSHEFDVVKFHRNTRQVTLPTHRQKSMLPGANNIVSFNPDSAVPTDAMSEEQTFRSEVNGSLPLSGHRSSVVRNEI